jgi:hypothetical protein
MLQRFLFIALTLCSLTATAQWQQTGSKVRYVNGLGIPTKDTAAGVAADSSQILIRPADSSLYIKYKRTWVKVGSGGTVSGTTNYVSKFTSATAIGNSQIFDNGTSVGIGTIPSSWRSGANAIQFGANGFGALWEQSSGSVDLAFAAYESATNTFAYKTTGDFPTLYQQVTGVHSWSNAPSGTAGNTITFNERMRISSGGNVLIGTPTDNGVDKLQVSGSGTFTNGVNMATSSGKVAIGTTTQTANLTVKGGYSVGGSIPTDWTFLSSGRMGLASSNKGFYFDIIGSSYAEFSTFDWGTSQPYTMVFQGNGGRMLLGTTTDNTVDRLQVNGSILSTQYKLSALNTAPATASSSGTLGEIRIDANYIYICTATNTWKRVAIATW